MRVKGTPKTTRLHAFPDKKKADLSYTHNLRALLSVAGLEEAWLQQRARDRTFRAKWDIVLLWSESSRYVTTSPERRGIS